MKSCFKIAFAIVFCIITLPDTLQAENFSFRLSANQNALDTELDGRFNVSETRAMAGIGGLYDNDDFKLVFLKGLIINELLIDGLTGGLGFKGVGGEVEKRRFDGDVLNIGFMGSVNYVVTDGPIKDYPLTLSASVCLAPEPLSFRDTEEFLEITAECGWKILEQAAVVLNYRYIEIDFDNSNKNRQKSDSTGYLGLKFFF